MRLFLVRHGQTAWNLESRAQGHTDIPLDDVGQRQAQLLGDSFRAHRNLRVVSSDLSRSADTAAPVASAVESSLELDVRLRERSFGEWEGMGFHELRKAKEDVARAEGIPLEEVVPPHGESIMMVWHRLKDVAGELLESRRDIVVVTHGGSCALLLSRLILGDWHTARAFRFANASITELVSRAYGGLLISRYNDSSHLADAMPLMGDLEGSNRPA